MTKILTKSLFTTALECPRKLYYAVHGNEYDNANSENDFLRYACPQNAHLRSSCRFFEIFRKKFYIIYKYKSSIGWTLKLYYEELSH
jgi:hypothetical protein